MNGPDKYTHAWYHQQMSGMEHLLRRLAAEYDSQHELIVRLTERVESLEAEREQLHAQIGDLLGRVATAEQWQATTTERLRVRFAELAKGNGHG